MELDWGMDVYQTIDHDQNYKDLLQQINNENEDDYLSDESLGSDDNSRSMVSDRKKKRKRSGKAQKIKDFNGAGGSAAKARFKKGYLNSIESFYTVILAWKMENLLEGTRKALFLSPLPDFKHNFVSKSEYFNQIKQVPLEEAREQLTRTLTNPPEFVAECQLQDIVMGRARYNRNRLCSVNFVLSDANKMKYFKAGSLIYFVAKTSGVEKMKFSSNLTNSELHRRISALKSDGFLGAVSQTGGNVDQNVVQVWAHSIYSSQLNSSKGLFVAIGLCNIITFQRMFTACDESPNILFINHLMGHQSPTHTIFLEDGVQVNKTSLMRNSSVQRDYSHMKNFCSFELDRTQFRALDNCLTTINLFGESNDYRSTLHLVCGPPGCGKSHFIAYLLHWINFMDNSTKTVENYLRKRILVCAASNKAISVITELFLNSAIKSEELRCCLLGCQDKIELSANQSKSDSKSIIEISNAVSSHIASLDNSKLPLTSKDLVPKIIHSVLQKFYKPRSTLDIYANTFGLLVAEAISLFRDVICIVIDCNFNPSNRKLSKKVALKALLNILVELRAFFMHLHGLIPLFINEYSLQGKCNEILAYIVSDDPDVANFDINCDLTKLCILNTDYIFNNLSYIKDSFGYIVSTFSSLGSSFEIAENLLQNSFIVFCTLSSSGLSMMKKFGNSEFDLLVVDEASQTLEAELMIPLCLKPKSMILVGDPKQLPATVFSQEAVSKRLNISALQRLLEFCNYESDVLRMQYRMHPEISSFPNLQFYNGHLINSPTISMRELPPCEVMIERYFFVNVNNDDETDARSKSFYNAAEAAVVVKLVEALLEFLLPHQITVITFYSGQVAEIAKRLKSIQIQFQTTEDTPSESANLNDNPIIVESNKQISKVRVMTVDSFQGSESDVVILSFVRCNSVSNVGFVKDFQRLNVSLTRAKELLVLVGNATTLESSSSQDLQAMVRDIRCRQKIVEATSLFT